MTPAPEVLFMTWQDQVSRAILPIGRIVRTAEGYEFAYIRAALDAATRGFSPLLTFPDFESVYRTRNVSTRMRQSVFEFYVAIT